MMFVRQIEIIQNNYFTDPTRMLHIPDKHPLTWKTEQQQIPLRTIR